MYLENTVGSKVITVNVVDTGVKQDLVPPCATVGTLPHDPNHRPPACPQQPQVVGLVLLGPLWGLCLMFLQPGREPVAHPCPLAQEQEARVDHSDEAIGLQLGTLHKLGWH